MSRYCYLVPAIFLLLGLLLAGCGDSTPTPVPTTAASTTALATTAAATTLAPTAIPATTLAATTAAVAATAAASVAKVDQIEPKAGSWKTWVLTSGNQFRRAAPPDKAATEAEIKQLKDLATKRDAAALDQISFWDTGGPSYRWNEFMLTYNLKNNLGSNLAARNLALLHVAIYDGLIAAWDSKYTFNRPRPSDVDSSLTTVISNPRTPAYPSEFAVAAGAGAAVLAYIFPDDAAFFMKKAEEATQSRLLAGVEYPSDITAGLELGRSVAGLVIERGRSDGSDAKWTGSVPTEPGKWNGTNPIFPIGGTLKPWVLSAPNEFRPGPPPAYDSDQEKADMDELRNFQRTPKTNADAFFWEYAAGGPRAYQFWNEQTGQKIMEYHLDANPVRAARVYALASIAMYDTLIACWDAKFTYWAIRPFMLDKEFKPLFTTPNHPSYPAAHATNSTSQAVMLAYLFPRDAEGLKAMGAQAGESRIWAGIHFRTDVVVGTALGQKVSQKVIERAKADGS